MWYRYRLHSPRSVALLASIIGITAAVGALLVRTLADTADTESSPTVTLVIAALAAALSAAAASSLRFLPPESYTVRTAALTGGRVEQEATVVSDIRRLLEELPPFEQILLAGFARPLVELADDMNIEFFSRRSRVRMLLLESGDYDVMVRYLQSRWTLLAEVIELRSLKRVTTSAIIVTDTALLYRLEVPGSRSRAGWNQDPWLLMTRSNSGPIWYEWRDELERMWRGAEPVGPT